MMTTTTPTPRRPDRHPGRARRRGLSLSEVMISLAITSMLLTAIAAAFHSSSQIITANDEFFRATQAARVALNQMLTEVRRADEVPAEDRQVGAPAFTVYKITADRLPVSRPAAAHLTQEFMRYYEYDAAAKTLFLYFQDPVGNLSPKYPVATNVQRSPFAWDQMTGGDNSQVASRVTITLDVAVGNNRIQLSGSASPRRCMKFDE